MTTSVASAARHVRPTAQDDVLHQDEVGHRVTKHGLEVVQYIKGLYDSGAKIWTKEMFQNIEAELANDIKPSSVMVRSMNGLQRRRGVPAEGIDDKDPDMGFMHHYIMFKIYQEILYEAEEEELEIADGKDIDWEDSHNTIAPTSLELALISKKTLTIDFAELEAAWNESQHNWTLSSAYSELVAVLRKATFPPTTNKIVCFGLGSLEGSQDYPTLQDMAKCDGLPRRAAITQHAAALTIAEVLGQQLQRDPLPIYAQDPAYSPTATRILEEKGINVVGGCGSLAFTLVDDDTVVFSCHPNIAVKQIVADIARPVAMLWNRVTPEEEENSRWTVEIVNGEKIFISPWLTDQDSPRTRALVEGYEGIPFPEEQERFGDLVMYIRQD
ncbi:hypothetical protein JX265_010540 [Neoarthrinium moseri]|uniref:SRR1-like domain-containing protein n=1 Tax=Neoarthrinium moseri TaxID=1658444 RepID=A0A9Q0ALL8_9PEZI|nr:hypothetical protein JX265_010540 [Neoarthrinium moseri]